MRTKAYLSGCREAGNAQRVVWGIRKRDNLVAEGAGMASIILESKKQKGSCPEAQVCPQKKVSSPLPWL